jgi:hypothetical protein
MLLEIEPYSIQANMQRAGRRAKKDNTNKAKSSRGSASANQNVININLGHLTERTVTERKKKKIETKKKRPVKKEAEEKPVVKKPKTEPKPEVERLTDLKKQYTELTRSVDMRMIPEGCRDVPDRLLTPTTPEQVRELIRYLEDCIRKIRLTSSRGMVPPTGVSVSPTPGMPPAPPGAGGVRLPGAPSPLGFYGGSTYAQQVAEQQRREKEEEERKKKEEEERKKKEEEERKKKKPPQDKEPAGPGRITAQTSDNIPPNMDKQKVKNYVRQMVQKFQKSRRSVLQQLNRIGDKTSDRYLSLYIQSDQDQLELAAFFDKISVLVSNPNYNTFSAAETTELLAYIDSLWQQVQNFLQVGELPEFTREMAQKVSGIQNISSTWGKDVAQRVVDLIAQKEGKSADQVIKENANWLNQVSSWGRDTAWIFGLLNTAFTAAPTVTEAALSMGAVNMPGLGAILPAGVAAATGPLALSVGTGAGIAALAIAANEILAGGPGSSLRPVDDPTQAPTTVREQFRNMISDLREQSQVMVRLADYAVTSEEAARGVYNGYVKDRMLNRRVTRREYQMQLLRDAAALYPQLSEDDQVAKDLKIAMENLREKIKAFFVETSRWKEEWVDPDDGQDDDGQDDDDDDVSPPPSGDVDTIVPEEPKGPDMLQEGMVPHPSCPDSHPKLCSGIMTLSGEPGDNGGALCLRADDRCDMVFETWSLRGLRDRATRPTAFEEGPPGRGGGQGDDTALGEQINLAMTSIQLRRSQIDDTLINPVTNGAEASAAYLEYVNKGLPPLIVSGPVRGPALTQYERDIALLNQGINLYNEAQRLSSQQRIMIGRATLSLGEKMVEALNHMKSKSDTDFAIGIGTDRGNLPSLFLSGLFEQRRDTVQQAIAALKANSARGEL